jgi:hypothetical protein
MRGERQNNRKRISPSRQRRNLKRLRERLAEAKSQLDKAIARRGARKRIKNNTQINEGKSQIIPIIDLVNNSDSEIEYNTNCTEVSFDDEVEDITDCRILGSSKERALRRRSLRDKDDAKASEQAKLDAQNNHEYFSFMRKMDQQQREDGNILLPRPPKEWEERERTWRDSWTYSPHVISANELMRIAHAGRAVERQRVIDSQASFRQFAQDWRNRSISRAA